MYQFALSGCYNQQSPNRAGDVRVAGRSTQGVKLLNLEPDDKVAAAVVIPPEDIKEDEQGTLLQ